MEEDVITRKKWKVRADATKGNKGTYDYPQLKYTGTAQATMRLPVTGETVWEIDAQVTFVKDPARSGQYPDMDFYTTAAEGTVTQTSYTAPGMAAAGCYGIPASFTDTYPIAVDDGHLTVKSDGDPVQYAGGATITGSTPVQDHPFQLCCSWRNPPCEDDVLEAGSQQHQWWFTGPDGALVTAQPDGTLQGTGEFFGTTYEWEFTPVEEAP
jgi:hypothetical protein